MRDSQIKWLAQAEKHFQDAQNGDNLKYESGKYGFNNMCTLVSLEMMRNPITRDMFTPDSQEYYDECKLLLEKYTDLYKKDMKHYPESKRVEYDYFSGLECIQSIDPNSEFGDTVIKMFKQNYKIRCNDINRTMGDPKEVEYGDKVMMYISDMNID